MEKYNRNNWNVGWGDGLCGDVVSWSVYLDEKDCCQIPIYEGRQAVAVIYCNDKNLKECTKNAKLMALAPQMKALLEDICLSYPERIPAVNAVLNKLN